MKPIRDMTRLELAALVAQAKTVDLVEIRRWSEAEGKSDKFTEIRARLESEKRKGA